MILFLPFKISAAVVLFSLKQELKYSSGPLGALKSTARTCSNNNGRVPETRHKYNFRLAMACHGSHGSLPQQTEVGQGALSCVLSSICMFRDV